MIALSDGDAECRRGLHVRGLIDMVRSVSMPTRITSAAPRHKGRTAREKNTFGEWGNGRRGRCVRHNRRCRLQTCSRRARRGTPRSVEHLRYFSQNLPQVVCSTSATTGHEVGRSGVKVVAPLRRYPRQRSPSNHNTMISESKADERT